MHLHRVELLKLHDMVFVLDEFSSLCVNVLLGTHHGPLSLLIEGLGCLVLERGMKAREVRPFVSPHHRLHLRNVSAEVVVGGLAIVVEPDAVPAGFMRR